MGNGRTFKMEGARRRYQWLRRLMPDDCEVCEGSMVGGDVRVLYDGNGGQVVGHIPCVDQLVRERQQLGQVHLGDVDLRPGPGHDGA